VKGEMGTVKYRDADLNMRHLKLPNGYDESDFTEDYWLENNEMWGSRINKSAERLISYLKDLFNLFGEGTVLDVGAGAGGVVHQLRQAGINADGKEFSASGRKLAKEKFGIDLGYLDLRESIDCLVGAYDYTVCFGVLSMIPATFMQKAISEIVRVTKKATLVCVQTMVGGDNNMHHITPLSKGGYYSLFRGTGREDITSVLPPMGQKYGIGISSSEFCGLFVQSGIIVV
jgi:SAM-dependent methyltransferase